MPSRATPRARGWSRAATRSSSSGGTSPSARTCATCSATARARRRCWRPPTLAGGSTCWRGRSTCARCSASCARCRATRTRRRSSGCTPSASTSSSARCSRSSSRRSTRRPPRPPPASPPSSRPPSVPPQRCASRVSAHPRWQSAPARYGHGCTRGCGASAPHRPISPSCRRALRCRRWSRSRRWEEGVATSGWRRRGCSQSGRRRVTWRSCSPTTCRSTASSRGCCSSRCSATPAALTTPSLAQRACCRRSTMAPSRR